MKSLRIILFLVGLCFFSCVPKKVERELHFIDETVKIPQETVDITEVSFDPKTSTWRRNNELFSGYVEQYYPNRSIKQSIGVLNGKRQKQTHVWFPDGHLKEVSNYHKGKLHGVKKIWTAKKEHTLVAHLNYYLGKAHGLQTQWYPTGELYKKMNFNKGMEEGIQQAYRKNGALYANYEARKGRIFGLKKSKLCFGLTDEELQLKNN